MALPLRANSPCFSLAATWQPPPLRPSRRPWVALPRPLPPRRSAPPRQAVARRWPSARGPLRRGPRLAPAKTGSALFASFSAILAERAKDENTVVMLQPQWQKVQYKLQPDPYRVARRIFPLILLHGVWSLVVLLACRHAGFRWRLAPVVHPLLGGVLGLLLAFRTNQAYERHWSSCKHWADLHRILHNMARIAAQLSRTDWASYTTILRYLIAYPIALKQHLQRRRDPTEYMQILEVSDLKMIMNTKNPQTMILASISMLIRPLRLQDDASGKLLALWTQLEAGVAQLQETASKLDLVVKVKLPESYGLHTARFIFWWVATLPFVLADTMHPVLVFFTLVFVAWALYSTEDLAQLMEEPFGTPDKPETIPVGEFCRQIVEELKEQIVVIDTLESRVLSGSWVVKPEDLIAKPYGQTSGSDVSNAFTVDD